MKLKIVNKCVIHDDFSGGIVYHCDPFMGWESMLFRDDTPKTEHEMTNTTAEIACAEYKSCAYYRQKANDKFYCVHLSVFSNERRPEHYDNECTCEGARKDVSLTRRLEEI